RAAQSVAVAGIAAGALVLGIRPGRNVGAGPHRPRHVARLAEAGAGRPAADTVDAVPAQAAHRRRARSAVGRSGLADVRDAVRALAVSVVVAVQPVGTVGG